MAVYLISDIHGALGALRRLLNKIEFRYDGRDELYLIGDFGDWGSRSIETFLFCMELSESSHVHCLMGNHDSMFLEHLEKNKGEENVTWLKMNMGSKTWEGYRKLSGSQQDALKKWLGDLKHSVDISLNGQLYMAAHAYPYFGNRGNLGEIYSAYAAEWKRMRWNTDPFLHYHGRKKYRALICGHTITEHYREQAAIKDKYGHNAIFFGPHFIDIDCGAKCFEYGYVWKKEAERARLAALRLDDIKEFYVNVDRG